ncbi:MAG: VirB3 family type IV secretion system protein [Caulobacteraceae bacterium]
MNNDEPHGYRIALHTSISAPVTMGGVPRMIAIGIGTVTTLISISFEQPWFGVPFGMLLWAIAYGATKADPYFFQVLDRHARHRSHWEA